MCGIALIWDPGLSAAARARIAEAMGEALRHRGPDGEGLFTSPVAPLALAHKRLAIQGLGEQGAQPMLHPEGLGALIYNGELFGAEPLRHELERAGVVFHGHSDTEILLHALARWGVAGALERIRGQFAFAWFDARTRRLFLARDRVGIRPLYYAERGGRLAAASEQKALLLLRWVDRTIVPEAALRYLVLSRTDDIPGQTMLAGVRSVPAGHYGEWDGDTLRLHRYYRAPVELPLSTIAGLRRELERAVDAELISDVPVGAMVSGGLDSSAVALFADRARVLRGATEPLHLFAYHDARALKDERPYQRAVLEAMKSPHCVHWVSSSPAELAHDFERYIHHQEEPYGDASSYAEHTIAREAARHGVKVLLSGLGGDEVFVGYPAFIGPLMLELLREGQLDAARELVRLAPRLGDLGRWNAVFAALYHAFPTPVRNVITALRASKSARLPPSLALLCARDAAARWHRYDGNRATNAALRGALESWSVPRYLLHSDRMSLAAGVEGRVPLLDHGVIEAAWGIPAQDRLGITGLKASLRAAASDVLPPLVRDRAWKLGFHAPLARYVAELEEPLRQGHAVAMRALGNAPRFATLGIYGRWLWGNLGAYLRWANERPYAAITDDSPASIAPVSAHST